MQRLAINDAPNVSALVRRIIAGDRQAEEELVQRHIKAVSILIKQKLRNPTVAEDLTQDTFRIAIRKIRLGEVREPERLSGFICGIARTIALNHSRKVAQSVESVALSEVTSPVDSNPDPLKQLLQRELANVVRKVIGELKEERDRQMIFRYYILEEEKWQICANLGLSSLHFNRVLFRARKRFKELYEIELKRQESHKDTNKKSGGS